MLVLSIALTVSSLWNGRKIKHILDNGPTKLVILDPKLEGWSDVRQG